MDKNNTIIAVDLHGVLFKHDYKKMFKTYFKSKNKLKLIVALLSPSLWQDVIKLRRKHATAEEFLVGLAKTHPRLQPFVPLGIKIANQQKPNQELIALLKKLKQKGYTLHLFSNIGSVIFNDLQKKFPEIFTLFHCITLPSQENHYRRKPSKEAFEAFLQQHKAHKKLAILIDDKLSNVKAADSYGISGIFFKNMDQLRQELRTLGVIVD